MAVCTFFGHRDCPETIRPRLRAVVVELIEQHGVDRFYAGQQGAFDAMARSVLRELAKVYHHISYTVVLERLPGPREKAVWDFSDSIFPEGLETVPPRFAISKSNDWMLKQADFVVTYITHNWGGAAQYAEKAHRQGKRVLNLAENCKF
ncbi:hypothetical protein [Intestinimonas butyriciproducens]|uniref:hypothetical protein n=1 Tax=Intestinimonas butyriciproducens TaxID=1297617 RepID=UPI001958BF04|nr:hypothetical protein [Intestinimonas butyriciproducens]MBM6917455.1 hypothetical protein [Intestinimonas butyriciproducens]